MLQRGQQDGEEPGEEDGAAPARQGKKRAWESDGSDSEAERERDKQAKEEFEERLRARDEAKTRKIAEARLSKAEIEARTGSAIGSASSHGPACSLCGCLAVQAQHGKRPQRSSWLRLGLPSPHDLSHADDSSSSSS